MEVTLSTEETCDIEEVKNQLPEESQLVSHDSGKIVFSIPFTQRLPNDFDRIEENKDRSKDFNLQFYEISFFNQIH